MGKANRDRSSVQPWKNTRGIGLLVAVIALASIVLFMIARGGSGRSEVTSAPGASSAPPMARLTGRWLRPDGGYVLEIKGVESGGRLLAAYYNPRSIHVATAKAAEAGDTLSVFVELRDEGYPGATYTLNYDAKADAMRGLYYQPSVGQTFDVVFTRLK